MKADTLTVKALFQKEVHYVIPTFQRPYVWTQEKQWEPLWEDIRNLAERYGDQLVVAEGKQALAEEKTGSHFLGAVVLQQLPTASAEIETRTVIDGQQRLTTLQLFVDAAQQVFEERNAQVEAERVKRLVLNAYTTGDRGFKLWPTSLDQPAFRAAMTNDAPTAEFRTSLIVQAHDFFRFQIREWLAASLNDDARGRKIHGLETAIYGLIEMVVIDLGTGDDAHIIFETLNARGTPLRASDLVKNYVLQTATAIGHKADEVYATHWLALEQAWWRQEVRQGRLTRPRVDVFLNYWLIMCLADDVPTHEVFSRFRAHVEPQKQEIMAVVTEVKDVATVYRGFDKCEPFSPDGVFWYRWRTVDAGVTTPLMLWLFSQDPAVLDGSQRQRCLRAIESFLVRRLLCRMTTKSYNDLFLELLKRLKAAGPGQIAETLMTYLGDQTADSRLWPSDHDLQGALLDLPLYRLLTRGRLRMVLEALEDKLRSPKSEEEHVPRGTLTIEHILPQQWQAHWPLLTEHDRVEREIERDRVLHSLGNLTLVNTHLNPALSHGPWTKKRAELGAHSVLHLNKQLLDGWGEETFAESEIRARGKILAELVTAIWENPVGL